MQKLKPIDDMKISSEAQEIIDAIDALSVPDYSCDKDIADIDDCEDDDNEMTIISALDRVVGEARKSRLNSDFWNKFSRDFVYLCNELEMTRKEVVIIGVLSEIGQAISWEKLGNFLGVSRLKAMSLKEEISNLKNKKWIRYYFDDRLGEKTVLFRLAAGVVTALLNNEKFIPEKIEGLSEQAFVDRLSLFYKIDGSNLHICLDDKIQWLNEFCAVNRELPLCRVYFSLKEDASRRLLLLAINDYARYSGTPAEGLIDSDIEDWFEDVDDLDKVKTELIDGSQELFGRGIFEYGTTDGLADTSRWKLTLQAREDLLGAYKPRIRHKDSTGKKSDRDLRSYKDISEKELYYNPKEYGQIARIGELVSKDGFDRVKARLSESGFRSGVCCLFYGAPGTGKTETVLQLARKTERDILQVNIAGLRDKYVGESEKNIKMVFNRYKRLCQSSEHIPILLFNEADAIFGCRFEDVRSSVEKMDNAIQNIILQEMETFEGILIATTNLTDNLDSAFDRRFLFKIEFSNPGVEARAEIWHSMLPELGMEDCKELAKEFDLSGGQIENIARKFKIEYITTGIYPDNDKLRAFCKEERVARKHMHKRVGF